MYVRLLTGRYAGEERDVRADMARTMIADGRAERVVDAPDAPAQPKSQTQQVPTPAKKAKKVRA